MLKQNLKMQIRQDDSKDEAKNTYVSLDSSVDKNIKISGNTTLLVNMKLRWHVSGSSIGMNPRPSALVHWHSSSPTLNPFNQPC